MTRTTSTTLDTSSSLSLCCCCTQSTSSSNNSKNNSSTCYNTPTISSTHRRQQQRQRRRQTYFSSFLNIIHHDLLLYSLLLYTLLLFNGCYSFPFTIITNTMKKHHPKTNNVKLMNMMNMNLSSNNNNNNNNNHNKNNNNNNENNSNSKPKYQTTSQKLSSEYNTRRLLRINENIPGKTSAIPGMKDLPLNIQQTENEYYNSLYVSDNEKKRKEIIQKGLDYLKGLDLENAKLCFESILSLQQQLQQQDYDHNDNDDNNDSNGVYCWQYGLVLFYLGDYYKAAQVFVYNGHLYEKKFGIVASEERLWRDVCELKIRNLDPSSSTSSIAQFKNYDNNGDNSNSNNNSSSSSGCGGDDDSDTGMINSDVLLMKETRKVIRIARDLFTSSIEKDLSNEALARGKLRSICGEYQSSSSSSSLTSIADKKMWRLNSWFYLGLHYDAKGDFNSSRDCMKMALRQCASTFGNGDDSKF